MHFSTPNRKGSFAISASLSLISLQTSSNSFINASVRLRADLLDPHTTYTRFTAITFSLNILIRNWLSGPILLNIECSLRTIPCNVEMLLLMTGPCWSDAWAQLGSLTILKKSDCPSMYVLANDEGSPRLGSIFARRVNSVIEVFKTDKLRAEDIFDANDTLVRTEVRNSDVCEVMTGFTVDVDDGIK